MSLPPIPEALSVSPVDVRFAPGALAGLGRAARELGARHVLLVSDPGLMAVGHVDRALAALSAEGLTATLFTETRENPTTGHVAAGVEVARKHPIDLIVGLGGGSAMDCAKGINLLLTNGGRIADYWGVDKTHAPLRPMILIPTTAGTGSEAQSFALISDEHTHQKMACGDRRHPAQGGLRPRIAILDPELTRTAPRAVAAAAALDAVSHAVETAASRARTPESRALSRAAWGLLRPALSAALRGGADASVDAEMILGAHLAGAAIENSMLGAAHACANPLTAAYGVVHGCAVALMLPHVVRFNTADGNPYADLEPEPGALVEWLSSLVGLAGAPRRLRDVGVPQGELPELARGAAAQWTAGFNPRPVAAADLLELYERAW